MPDDAHSHSASVGAVPKSQDMGSYCSCAAMMGTTTKATTPIAIWNSLTNSHNGAK